MKKIKDLWNQYKELILYLFFGGCTTLVNIVVYFIFSRLHFGTGLSTIFAWFFSVLFAYITNRIFVFQSRAKGISAVLKEALSFFSCRLATGILDLAIMVAFVDYWHFNDLFIKVLSNIIVIILNYIASKLWIFKKKAQTDSLEKNNRRTFLEKCPDYFRILFCVYIIGSLLLNLIIDKNFNYSYPSNFLAGTNLFPFLFSIILFLLSGLIIYFLQQKKEKKHALSSRQFYIILAIIFLLVYLLQLFIAANIYMMTGWDAGICIQAAEDIALHGADGVPQAYFSQNPNNIFLIHTLVAMFKLGNFLHSSNPFAVVLAINCLIVCVSVFLAVLCVYKITEKKSTTMISAVFGIILIALSPWIVVPYTDTLTMIFPIGAIFCYLFIKNLYLKYSLFIFLCLLGYFYKPTTVIVLIALIIIKICTHAKKAIKKQIPLKQLLCLLVCFIITACVVIGINKVVLLQNKTELDEQSRKTITHYLMMGLNPETEGVYCQGDVNYTLSFPDIESRQKANIEETKNRLKNMGVKGTLKLLIKKNIANYNNGTFAWGAEGSSFAEVPEKDNLAAKALRSFYYTQYAEGQGTHYQMFATIEQSVWFMILISIGFCILHGKSNNDAENLIALSLLGVSMFLLIFECRARYLFMFSPLFLILASSGLNKAAMFMKDLKDKFKNKRPTIKESGT